MNARSNEASRQRLDEQEKANDRATSKRRTKGDQVDDTSRGDTSCRLVFLSISVCLPSLRASAR